MAVESDHVLKDFLVALNALSSRTKDVLRDGVPKKRDAVDVGDFSFFDGGNDVLGSQGARIDDAFPVEGVPKEHRGATEDVVERDPREDVAVAWMEDGYRFFRHVDGAGDLIAESLAI